jgi:hypothetical protein
MAQVIHKTKSRIGGPFYVDRDQLGSLVALLNQEWSRLSSRNAEEMSEEVEKLVLKEKKLSYNQGVAPEILKQRAISEKNHYFKERKSCILTVSTGDAISFPDLESALRDPILLDKEVTGIGLGMEAGKRSCSININRYGYESYECEIQVEPKGDHLAQETLTVLRNWQNTVRPPAWLKLWYDANGAHWFLWLGALVMSFFYLMGPSK